MPPGYMNSPPLRWLGILSKDIEFASKEQIVDGSKTRTSSSKLRPTGFQAALICPLPLSLPRVSLNPALYTEFRVSVQDYPRLFRRSGESFQTGKLAALGRKSHRWLITWGSENRLLDRYIVRLCWWRE